MKADFALLARYVNNATDLAESLRRDIMDGNKISKDTRLYLSEFIESAETIKDIIDSAEKSRVGLN